jgi:2-oxoglutarate ferredoxin oxidoreductase subunit alpha
MSEISELIYKGLSMDRQVRVMTGNESCALGAITAGCRFFAGYPITPSSEIAEHLSADLPKVGGKYIQMEDEIGAMGAIIGASLVGVKAMTATSGPGFSLKQENIGYACIAEIPCVVVNVMRGGPSTGLPTLPSQMDVMQARWGTHGDHPIIALVPNSVRETFDLTVRAFNLSETYRTPVIILLDEILGHVNEKVKLPDPSELKIVNRTLAATHPDHYLPYEHVESDIPPFISFGEGYRFHVTGLCHDQTGFPTNYSVEIDRQLRRLNRKIDRYKDHIIEVEEYLMDDAEVGVFAYGSVSRSAKRAVVMARERGVKAGLLRPLVIWPFPEKQVEAMGKKVKKIVVAEMNLGQIAHEVEWATRRKGDVVKVNRIDGEPIHPDEILEAIL